MAVSFLTRLQQTINTALSPDTPAPVSPTTPNSSLPRSAAEETPTKGSSAMGDEVQSTTSTPLAMAGERGRSLATPNGSALNSNTGKAGGRYSSHLDARLGVDQDDIFSPSDRTITQAQASGSGSTSTPRGSVEGNLALKGINPIILGGNLPPGSVGRSMGTEGSESTPSTATVKRFETSVEGEAEGDTKRRRKKRGVNEVSYSEAFFGRQLFRPGLF